MNREELEQELRYYRNLKERLEDKIREKKRRLQDILDSMGEIRVQIGKWEGSIEDAKRTVDERLSSVNAMSRFRDWYREAVVGILTGKESASGFAEFNEGLSRLGKAQLRLEDEIDDIKGELHHVEQEINAIRAQLAACEEEAES